MYVEIPSSRRHAHAYTHHAHSEERQRLMATYGDKWEDRPNDFLQWLMDHEDGQKQMPQDYCKVRYIRRLIFIHL